MRAICSFQKVLAVDIARGLVIKKQLQHKSGCIIKIQKLHNSVQKFTME